MIMCPYGAYMCILGCLTMLQEEVFLFILNISRSSRLILLDDSPRVAAELYVYIESLMKYAHHVDN
jgi:hypothetical protein